MISETLVFKAVEFIIKGIKNSKGGKQATDEISTKAWNWLRPKLIKKDIDAVNKIEQNPEKYSVLGEHLVTELVKNEEFKADLMEWINKINSKENEKSSSTTNMIHTGSGDNIGGDKHIH